MSMNWRLLMVTAAGLCAMNARAQEGSRSTVLAALVEEALQRNPEMAEARQLLSAARSRPAQAGALSDPMISVDYTNDGWAPSLGTRQMTTLAFTLSQELPQPGKRGLRAQVATLDAARIEQQLERVRRGVVAAVERAYADLGLARDVAAVVEEQAGVWRQIEGVARARYAVGQGAQQDVLRVQVEMTRVEQFRIEQAAEAEVRLAELNRLRAAAADAPVETSGSLALRPVAADPAERLRLAEAASPELRAAALAVDRERTALELAKKESRPDFTLQAGYMNRGGLDPLWQAGVGVTLPLFKGRNAGRIAEAEARLGASESNRQATLLRLRARTQERLARLHAVEKTATLYEKGIVPQGRMAVEAGLASYQAGQLPFLAVLESLASLYGDRTTLLRLRARHARLRASLEEVSLEATDDAGEPMGAGAGLSASAMSGGMGRER
jgi:outer membrane protein, heavy metal efflux system